MFMHWQTETFISSSMILWDFFSKLRKFLRYPVLHRKFKNYKILCLQISYVNSLKIPLCSERKAKTRQMSGKVMRGCACIVFALFRLLPKEILLLSFASMQLKNDGKIQAT